MGIGVDEAPRIARYVGMIGLGDPFVLVMPSETHRYVFDKTRLRTFCAWMFGVGTTSLMSGEALEVDKPASSLLFSLTITRQ